MNGYIIACANHNIGACHGIPEDFHDWAAYRTRRGESTAGWCHMITEVAGSDELAFDRFFKLLDEHASRRPTVFARFRNSTEQYSSWTDGQEARTFQYPTSIALVTYTDDPGFFALSEVEGQSFPSRNFFHSLDWFEARAGDLEIVDPEVFGRIKSESAQ
ncbi:MAG: hypothetical protein JWM59_1431 [Verrucomicrobiales bacterium]|nr:hypothetical protein [Verrucomicrobiales bacterium]